MKISSHLSTQTDAWKSDGQLVRFKSQRDPDEAVISKVSKRSATLKFQVKLHVCNLILALECLSAFCNVQLDYLFIDLQICGLFFFGG